MNPEKSAEEAAADRTRRVLKSTKKYLERPGERSDDVAHQKVRQSPEYESLRDEVAKAFNLGE